MNKCFFLLYTMTFFVSVSFSQSLPGKLVLVGGGSEDYNEWSDAPYQWAVDKSENKRVAVVTYDNNPSQWIPNYFESLGAIAAKNFSIPNRTIADLQETYDSLVSYDVIFFKGGNQEAYYSNYKNTLTQQAVEDVFNNGGVICGTSAGEMILSGVLFTAENGTVYPEEAIENPNNQYMTLEDDFMSLLPGYVFDSHVVERGRFARIIGFMGNWKLNHDEDIIGIAVDDKTAFCIDTDMTGYAFGTGAVGIYRAAPDNEFGLGGEKLLATHLEVTQLLHNCTIDLNTYEVNGFDDYIETYLNGESFIGHILFSASDNLDDNLDFLSYFSDAGFRDSVLIITGNNTSLAESFLAGLESNNTKGEIMQAIPANAGNEYYFNKVISLRKYLFVGNEYDQLMDFIYSGLVGPELELQIINGGETVVGLVGSDSRFAAGQLLINYDQEYASYDGDLEFGEGLGFLQSMIIMPNVWESSDIWENTAAGVPYGLLLKNRQYGLWLYDNTFAEYTINNQGETILKAFGDYPLILVETNGTYGGFSTQSAVNSGEPRDVAGFELFNFTLMDESTEYVLGIAGGVSGYQNDLWFDMYPNPAKNRVKITTSNSKPVLLKIHSPEGQLILSKTISGTEDINLNTLKSGMYVITMSEINGNNSSSQKLMIQ